MSHPNPRRVAGQYRDRLAVQQPSREFPKGDPDAPKVEGKQVLRLWKIKPGVVAFEVEGREFGVFLQEEALRHLSEVWRSQAWSLARKVRGIWVLQDRYLSALFFEHPEWGSLFERATGHKVDTSDKAIPYWYENWQIFNNQKPLRFDSQLEEVLKADGWRPKKDKVYGEGWIKAINGVWVRIDKPDGFFDKDVYVHGSKIPRRLERDRVQEFLEATSRRIEFRNRMYEDFLADVGRVAAVIKSWQPKRTRETFEDFEWNDHTGPEGYKAWVAETEAFILRELERQLQEAKGYYDRVREDPWMRGRGGPNYGQPTSWLTGNWLDNHAALPDSMRRPEAARRVRAILESLAKAGKIEKSRDGREIMWEYKK